MQSFHNVTVVPFVSVLRDARLGGLHRGGPIWPNWPRQAEARFRRGGRPVDVRPDPPPDPAPVHAVREAVWCGPIHPHFGHMLADFGMRIVPGATAWPGVPLLFGAALPAQMARIPPAGRMAAVPAFVRDLVRYAGADPEQAVVLAEPAVFETLHVVPQPEQLPQIGPSDAHLDLMDAHAEKALGPAPPRSGGVFVSRAGVLGPKARFAGERYLEEVMARAGVRVFRPEEHPLVEQLRVYRAADVLVFSEGSALHALQLLGRGLGDIVILQRREGHMVARENLLPRARSLRHVPVSRDMICHLTPSGDVKTNNALSLFDLDALFAATAGIGLDLRALWDAGDFAAAEHADAVDWQEGFRKTRPFGVPGSRELVAEGLARNGLPCVVAPDGAA